MSETLASYAAYAEKPCSHPGDICTSCPAMAGRTLAVPCGSGAIPGGNLGGFFSAPKVRRELPEPREAAGEGRAKEATFIQMVPSSGMPSLGTW
jgi:hypothetical protein